MRYKGGNAGAMALPEQSSLQPSPRRPLGVVLNQRDGSAAIGAAGTD